MALTPPGALIAPEPPKPVRAYSFTDWQVNNPTTPPPGDRLDAEFDRANGAISQTLDWAGTSLSTDGTLRAGIVGESQLVPGLFDDIADDAVEQVQPLVDQAGASATQAFNSATTAQSYSTLAGASATRADQAATDARTAATTAQGAANGAQDSAAAAASSAVDAANSANHAGGSEAVAEAYADVGMAWAEHMPDIIPPNILAVQGVTGDHWSSRWWANQAALTLSEMEDLLKTIPPLAVVNYYTYIATAGQVVFSGPDRDGDVLSYTPSPVVTLLVYANGLLRTPGDDYTGTADTVTFTRPRAAGDIVQIQVEGVSTDVGVYLPLTGGVMTGPITLAADPALPMQPVTLKYSDSHYLPFTGGVLAGPGNLTVNGSLKIGNAGTLTANSTLTPAFQALLNSVTGVVANPPLLAPVYQFVISHDTADASTIPNGLTGLQVLHNFGGDLAMKGGRFAITAQANLLAGTTGNNAANFNPFYGVANFWLTAGGNEGGTSPSVPGGWGQLVALNPQLIMQPTATNYMEASIVEWNIDVQAGASVARKYGIKIVGGPTDAVRGTVVDAAFKFGGSLGSVGWKNLILFGGDIAVWPALSGHIMRAELSTRSRTPSSIGGLSLEQIAFPVISVANSARGALRSNAFTVDGAGTTQIGTAYLTPGSAGLAVDVKGIVGAGTPTVFAGGSGYLVGDFLFDAWGGIYLVQSISGSAVATVSVYTDANGNTRQPYYPAGTPPANPVATTPWGSSYPAAGCTLTLAWDTSRRALQIQPTAGGTLGFYGSAPVAKQTGVAVTAAGIHAALTSLGLIAP